MSATIPTRLRPAATRPTPRAVLGDVDVELARGGGIAAPQGVSRAELDRVETRLLDHLTRVPGSRAALLTDPVTVLRAAAPDASAALVAAVTSTATRLPAGLATDRVRVGVAGAVTLPARPVPPRPAPHRPVQPTAARPGST